MKRSILYVLLQLMILSGFMQGQNSTICRLGFTYDVSKSPNWGNGKLVITHVYPYSSAKQAGLKVNDVIEAIDGIPVDSIAAGEIPGLLNPAKKNNVQLTISNLTESAKPVNVKKDCKRTDAITEDQLATAFAMYSLETTSEQLFVCPFTTTTDTMNYARYKTYSFAPVDENNRKLEETINACIEKEFKTKGLTHDTVAPDMLVETFYYYKKNPNFYAKENKASPERLFTYRYNFTSDRMEKFPFLSHAAAETDAEYLLQLGVRLIDKRFQTGRVLWECEANEMMSDAFRLDAYAQTHIPLMCMQYPYAKYNRNVQYLVSRKTYNYTGINYNINRLEQIMDITPNSPAHAAGLRMRDIIEKIDNQSMNHTAEEYTSAYKQFIMNTMSLRDPGTLFSDANGFRYCMHWDKFKYTQIAEAIQNPRNMAVFSYLYKYAPYVNPAGVNTCTFRVKRGKEKIDITVHPSIHTETSVIIK